MPGDRGDVDELAVALPLHDGEPSGNAVKHALDVNVDHAVPFVDLERLEGRERHQPRIVDHHVDLAELLLGELHERLHIFAIGHVQRAIGSRPAFGLNIGYDLLKAVDPPCAKHDISAAPGQKPRGHLTDAAARPGDGDDFPLQV